MKRFFLVLLISCGLFFSLTGAKKFSNTSLHGPLIPVPETEQFFCTAANISDKKTIPVRFEIFTGPGDLVTIAEVDLEPGQGNFHLRISEGGLLRCKVIFKGYKGNIRAAEGINDRDLWLNLK